MEELPIVSLARLCQVRGGPNPEAEVKPQSLRDIIWDRVYESPRVEQAIEAIILKHCPEDKAVREILAILKRLDKWGWAGLADPPEPISDILKDTRAALSDYEGKQE